MKFLDAREDFRGSIDALPSAVSRLLFLKGLKDAKGCFHHWGLEDAYGIERARDAMCAIAGEVIAHTLRAPLEGQYLELRQHLEVFRDNDCELLRGALAEGEPISEATRRHIEYQDYCFSRLADRS